MLTQLDEALDSLILDAQKEELHHRVGQCYQFEHNSTVYKLYDRGDGTAQLFNVQTGRCWNTLTVKIDAL
jgi:hypothetical protein